MVHDTQTRRRLQTCMATLSNARMTYWDSTDSAGLEVPIPYLGITQNSDLQDE